MILDSVVSSSKESVKAWRKSDTTWGLGLFGTAIGAGVPGIQIISATLMDEWREVANC